AVEATPQPEPKSEPQPEPAAAPAAAAKDAAQEAATTAPPREGGAQTSPAARAIAAEHGIDLAAISGTGPNSRITKEDVLREVERKQQSAAKPQAPPR